MDVVEMCIYFSDFIWIIGIDFDPEENSVLPSRSTGKPKSFFAQIVRHFHNHFKSFHSIETADVQRLDLDDCNLYGVSPSDPGPMVLCNQCNHIMAPEGIMRHVKRVHGSKIVPAPSSKLRIPTKGSSTAGSILPNTTTPNRLTNSTVAPQANDSTLSTEFSNRLNVSKMAPPTPINAATGMIKTMDEVAICVGLETESKKKIVHLKIICIEFKSSLTEHNRMLLWVDLI